MNRAIMAGFVLTLQACASSSPEPIEKLFNSDAFVGLEYLGSSYEEIRLAYGLDAESGETIEFRSCEDVEAMDENEFGGRQFQLFRLMKYNCKAAKMYYAADRAKTSFFPAALSRSFLENLPATAIPNIGGQSLDRSEKTLGEFVPVMEVVAASDKSIRVILDDTDIEYVELARADFDGDGIEDRILRLDWSIVSAFGFGFDLLVLNKLGADAPVDIAKRFPPAP